MKRTMMIMAMLLMACVVYAKDIKTIVLTTTPQMSCSSCEEKIKGNLRFEKGVKSIETNIAEQSVTIQYDAEKTNEETIIKAFDKFGYKAEKKVVEKKAEEKKVATEKAADKKDCCAKAGDKKECAKKDDDHCKKDGAKKDGDHCKKEGAANADHCKTEGAANADHCKTEAKEKK